MRICVADSCRVSAPAYFEKRGVTYGVLRILEAFMYYFQYGQVFVLETSFSDHERPTYVLSVLWPWFDVLTSLSSLGSLWKRDLNIKYIICAFILIYAEIVKLKETFVITRI